MSRMLAVSIVAGAFAFCPLALSGEGQAGPAVPDYHFDKPPQPLDNLKGVHPRLYLTKEHLGSTECLALLGRSIRRPQELQKARDEGIFKTRCPKIVKAAAEILEESL